MIKVLDRQSPLFYWVTCFVLVPVLGLVDFQTGYEFSFSLFYVGPIAIAAWYLGRRPGFVIAVASALMWFAADVQSGHNYSHEVFYIWNTIIRFGFFSIVVLLLSELDRSMDAERSSARTDQVTGAVNRRSFQEWVNAALERAKRHNSAFTLAYMDLDNFRYVNDHHGHSAGDAALLEAMSGND